MRQAKRGLAVLLAVLMLASILPVTALAADAVHAEDDVVMYCLGPEQTDEMFLVCWPEHLEVIRGYGIAGSCDAFEDDGSYTIQLPEEEDTVCFLYFGEDGDPVAQPETFTGADQTVTVKGHAFRAQAGGTPPAQGGSVIDPLTLFPTKQVNTSANLRGLFPEELKTEVTAEILLENVNGADKVALGEKIAWSYGSDSYQVINKGDPIDLSAMWSQNSWIENRTITILSKADPTATDIVRYQVYVTTSGGYNLMMMSGKPVSNEEESAGFTRISAYNRPNELPIYNFHGDSDKGYSLDKGVTMWASFGEDFKRDNERLDDLECAIYKGNFAKVDDIPQDAQPIENMWSKDGNMPASGYTHTNFPARDPQNPSKEPDYPTFTLVIKRVNTGAASEKKLMVIPFRVAYNVHAQGEPSDYSSIFPDIYYLYNKTGTSTSYVSDEIAAEPYGSRTYSYDSQNGFPKYGYTFMLKEGLKNAGESYVLRMRAEGGKLKEVPTDDTGEDQSSGSEADATEKKEPEWNAVYGSEAIDGAYVGTFNTLEEAQAAAEKDLSIMDIKNELFGLPKRDDDGNVVYQKYSDGSIGDWRYAADFGYSADFSKGVTISIFGIGGSVLQITVRTMLYTAPTDTAAKSEDGRSVDTYFYVTGAGGEYSSYYMSRNDDSYYDNGYQTIFLLKDSGPVTDGTIKPTFRTGNKVDVFAKHDEVGAGENATVEVSGETEHTFKSGEAIPYSAASERKTHLRNYWITFVTQQTGPQLFINGVTNLDASHREGGKEDGAPIREVLMSAGGHHDIFVANIGDAEVQNLSVELSDAENIKLDDYWNFGATRSLVAFTTTARANGADNKYGELYNVTKIRLLPDGNGGEVKGKLTIKGDGIEPQEIILKGTAGVPKITTASLSKAVKFVPYSVLIQSNHMYGSSGVVFRPASGTPLPAGLTLAEDGEIYGAPKAPGTYTFTVDMYYNGSATPVDSKEFTLEVLPNTDYNVYHASDSSYEILNWIGDDNPNQDETTDPNAVDSRTIQAGTLPDQQFRSEGAYLYFTKVWLDGEILDPSQYTAEEGSTNVLKFDASLNGNTVNGVHTIATEFREGGPKGTLKRTSQNYYVKGGTDAPPPSTPTTPNNPSQGGDSGGWYPSSGSGNSGSGSSSGGTSKPTTPGQTPGPSAHMPFADVSSASWYYEDVDWAYKQGLMVGESNTAFVPNSAISQATIVTVLARMLNVNLTRYQSEASTAVQPGQWYTEAAIWAQRAGLLPDNTQFTATAAISREDMAIMLLNYLISMGVDVNIDVNQILFSDAEQMSPAGLRAFRILYHYDIFRGVGGFRMDPAGTTTRAQFAALIHRISAFTERYKQ